MRGREGGYRKGWKGKKSGNRERSKRRIRRGK